MLRPTNQNREAHAAIDQQVREYLANGGTIKQCDSSHNNNLEERKLGLAGISGLVANRKFGGLRPGERR